MSARAGTFRRACSKDPAGAMEVGRGKAPGAGQLRLRFDAGAAAGNDRRCGLAPARETGAGEAAAWRALEPEMGDVAFVCPGCWPETATRVAPGMAVRARRTAGLGAVRDVRCGAGVLRSGEMEVVNRRRSALAGPCARSWPARGPARK